MKRILRPSLASSFFASLVFLTPLPAQQKDPSDENGRSPSSSGDPFIRDEGPSAAQSAPPPQGQHNLLFLTELIEVDPILLSDLFQDDKTNLSDGSAVRGVVEEWMTKDQAHRVDWSLQLGRNNRAFISSTAEIIYAVEWDPGQSLPLLESPTTGEGRPAFPVISNGTAYWPPASLPHPTAFEVRPAGLFGEVDISWEDDRLSPRIASAPERVILRGMNCGYQAPKEVVPEKIVSLPVITSTRVRPVPTEFPAGSIQWLGTSPTDGGRPVMTFMTATRPLPRTSQRESAPIRQVKALLELIEVEKGWIEPQFSPSSAGAWDAVQLRAELQKDIRGGAASLLGMIDVSASLGLETQSESTREWIYASEYDPASLPSYQVPKGTSLRYWSPDAYPTPTAYGTRNLGITFRLTAVELDEAKGLGLNLSIDYTEHLEDRVAHAFLTPEGVAPLCIMPTFSTLTLRTEVAAQPGEVLLLGSIARRQPNGEPLPDKQVLIFLRLIP